MTAFSNMEGESMFQSWEESGAGRGAIESNLNYIPSLLLIYCVTWNTLHGLSGSWLPSL